MWQIIHVSLLGLALSRTTVVTSAAWHITNWWRTLVRPCEDELKAKQKYRGIFELQSPEKWQVQERLVSKSEQTQVPSRTGPGVRRSKRPLLASRNGCKCSMDTSQNLLMSKSVIRSSSESNESTGACTNGRWMFRREMGSNRGSPS